MVTPNESLKDNYHATSQETEGFPTRKSDSFSISPREANFFE